MLGALVAKEAKEQRGRVAFQQLTDPLANHAPKPQ
jgi:hypothetical protein